MVKEMRLDWNPWAWPLHKHNHVFVKFLVSILLISLIFRIYSSHFMGFLPVSEPPTVAVKPEFTVGVNNGEPQKNPSSTEKTNVTQLPIPEMALGEYQSSHKEKCDLFTGEWIPNPSGPVYTNESCPVLEDHQNCMKNGRPDSEYLYWRWKPRDCELPMFDAKRFLDAMRNKSWALIGDSISRNHVQSLVCLLSKAEEAVEVYHDKEYKSKRWHFSLHNFTISVIWSPFLVKADIFEDNDGVSTSETELHLDTLDKKWTDEYENFDYIITSGGPWFLKTAIYWDNNTVVGCHYCPGRNLTELGFDYAYRKALQLVLRLLASKYKGFVLFRTSTPDHFENGQWFSGGTCNRTVPFKEGEISMTDVVQIMRSIEVEEFDKAASVAMKNGVHMKLLDTTHLSLLRPDGHPGPYRQFYPFAKDKNAKVQNDCLHWCLPGPIDSWNDLVMEMVFSD